MRFIFHPGRHGQSSGQVKGSPGDGLRVREGDWPGGGVRVRGEDDLHCGDGGFGGGVVGGAVGGVDGLVRAGHHSELGGDVSQGASVDEADADGEQS